MPDSPAHLAAPVRLNDRGDFATVAQDSFDDIEQSVHVVARTTMGARTGRPTFGVPDPTFTDGIDPGELAQLLVDQEPRAIVSVDDDGSFPARGLDVIRVQVDG